MSSELGSKEQQEGIIAEIFAENSPTLSGVRFDIIGGKVFLLPPLRGVSESDEVLFRWYEDLYGKSYDPSKPLSYEEYRKEILRLARDKKAGEFTGGFDVRARTPQELDALLPGVLESLANEKGRAVFLGNGLSPAPLVISKGFEEGKVAEPPVVVDMFDYSALKADFDKLRAGFDRQKLPTPEKIQEFDGHVDALLSAASAGSLVLSNYYVGSGNPPDQLQEAYLAVNCFGPNSRTNQEQLSLLASGGKLYTTNFIPETPGFDVTPIQRVLPSPTRQVFSYLATKL